MRKIKRLYVLGEIRTVTKFLWFPVTVYYSNKAETRWLERASIEYVLQDKYKLGVLTPRWIPSKFKDIK